MQMISTVFYSQLHPDAATFYYDTYPRVDGLHYNTWLDELKQKYAFFQTQKLKASNNGCVKYKQPNMAFVRATLTKKGGFYFSEQTMIASFSQNLRNLNYIDGYNVAKHMGFYMSARGLPGKLTVDTIKQDQRYKTKFIQCSDKSVYANATRKASCVNVLHLLFPKDIWELNDNFGKLARRVFYDTEEILRPKRNFTELVPNIAHVVWIGGGPMDFIFYLCALSLLYVMRVDTLYIHGNGPPSGQYWESIKHHPRLQLIYRESAAIYGTKVGGASHQSDVWRADFMVKYGGIYCDTGKSLRWRHDERDTVSNHRRLDYLLNRLFRRKSKKTSKLHVTGLCERNPPVTG